MAFILSESVKDFINIKVNFLKTGILTESVLMNL